MFDAIRRRFRRKVVGDPIEIPALTPGDIERAIGQQFLEFKDMKERQAEWDRYMNLMGASLVLEAESDETTDPLWAYALHKHFAKPDTHASPFSGSARVHPDRVGVSGNA